MAILLIVAIWATVGIFAWYDYQGALSAEAARLDALVRTQVRWTEALAEAERGSGALAERAWVLISDRVNDSADGSESLRIGLGQKESDGVGFLLLRGPQGLETPASLPSQGSRGEALRRALAGKSGVAIGPDHRGVAVVAAHAPIAGTELGLIAQRDLDEIRTPHVYRAVVLGSLALLGGGAAFGLSVALGRARRRQQDDDARLRAVTSAMHDALIVVDDQGRIESLNTAAEALLGQTASVVIGQPVDRWLSDTVPNPGTEGHLDLGLGGRRSLTGLSGEGRLLSLDGVAVQWVSAADGRTRHLLLLADRSEAEANSRRQQDLVATLGHELRAPLTSVQGALALLLGLGQGAAPIDREKLMSLTDIARRNGERLLHLVNGILDIEQLRARTALCLCRPENLAALIREAVAANEAVASRFSVVLTVHEPLPELVAPVDHVRLSQALGQLLSNAAKFSPPGETVEIGLFRHNPGMARIVIGDRGPGVSPELRAQLFEGFAQGPTVAGRPREGGGLGLAIAKAIVDQHRGAIDFADRPGGGTNFTIDLPLADDEASDS